MLMNIYELRMMNPIEDTYESEMPDESEEQNKLLELTEETADAIAEPIQPIYLMLKPEQYNLLVKYIEATGNVIAENTDLISGLPTAKDLAKLKDTLDTQMYNLRNNVDSDTRSMKSLTEQKISEQTQSINRTLTAKLEELKAELKARDMSPWKMRMKWALIGAIPPLSVLAWLLMSRL